MDFFLSHRKDTLPFKVCKNLSNININGILIFFNLHLYSVFSFKTNYSFFLFYFVSYVNSYISEIQKCTAEVDLQGLFKKWTVLLNGFCGGYFMVIFKIDQTVQKIKFLLIHSTASEFSNVVCFT